MAEGWELRTEDNCGTWFRKPPLTKLGGKGWFQSQKTKTFLPIFSHLGGFIWQRKHQLVVEISYNRFYLSESILFIFNSTISHVSHARSMHCSFSLSPVVSTRGYFVSMWAAPCQGELEQRDNGEGGEVGQHSLHSNHRVHLHLQFCKFFEEPATFKISIYLYFQPWEGSPCESWEWRQRAKGRAGGENSFKEYNIFNSNNISRFFTGFLTLSLYLSENIWPS